MTTAQRRRPEVWAGVECSFLRIGDRECDQLTWTGHAWRPDDIERLASIGVRAVRYPILWGWDPAGPTDETDWAWADERMARLEAVGIRPIVGLMHHGAGPAGATLLDADFPSRFAEYAAKVAARYPYIREFIPINEPLTTARFCGLYGFWPPNAADDETFVRLIVRQCVALRAAFSAIRNVRPDAVLIANEDCGRTFGTPEMSALVRLNNQRMWLAFDLLCGRVDENHSLWSYLIRGDDVLDDLRLLREDPIAPDVLGIDYYPTSDRYLDHRFERYPEWSHGGGGVVRRHANVELVRSGGCDVQPFSGAIRAVWERYGLPVAITEVQLDGRPDDQVAWWREAYRAAETATAEGIDVRAVTAWSAFGAWEWRSLMRLSDGYYEPGLFDSRWDPPVITPLGEAVRASAMGEPGIAVAPGWWRDPNRVRYGVAAQPTVMRPPPQRSSASQAA